MKTIRLLYPDYLSGGLDTYYFGANLLVHILPENENQPLVKVTIDPPDGKEYQTVDGMYAREEVVTGIQRAMEAIEEEKPDKIITIGGNCMVSQAPSIIFTGFMRIWGSSGLTPTRTYLRWKVIIPTPMRWYLIPSGRRR